MPLCFQLAGRLALSTCSSDSGRTFLAPSLQTVGGLPAPHSSLMVQPSPSRTTHHAPRLQDTAARAPGGPPPSPARVDGAASCAHPLKGLGSQRTRTQSVCGAGVTAGASRTSSRLEDSKWALGDSGGQQLAVAPWVLEASVPPECRRRRRPACAVTGACASGPLSCGFFFSLFSV